jgi:hypothetical protein
VIVGGARRIVSVLVKRRRAVCGARAIEHVAEPLGSGRATQWRAYFAMVVSLGRYATGPPRSAL